MRPLRFWSLFLALVASATVFFPRIAGAKPDLDTGARPEGQKRRPVVKTVIVKIGRPYRAENHVRPHRIPKGKRK